MSQHCESDECALCGVGACNCPSDPNATHYISEEHGGSRWRLCFDCWVNLNQAETDAAIYERHVKPKEQPRRMTFAEPDPYKLHAESLALSETSIGIKTNLGDVHSGRRAALVAALALEHVNAAGSTGLLHPLSNWSGRNPGRRTR